MPPPRRRGGVVVVGSVNVDTTIRVVRLPRAGETALGTSLATGLGGKGANQAVASARLGAPTVLIAGVGDDDAGRTALSLLEGEGVDVSCVLRVARGATGVAHIAVDDEGANQITVAPLANNALTVEHVEGNGDAVAAADVVLCSLECPLDAIATAIRMGRRASARTVLNAAPARPLPAALTELVDVLVVNETEAAVLGGIDALPCASAIVTMGEQGALLVRGGEQRMVPGYDVTAVDTTGAGDAFCGALAAALWRGDTLNAAVDEAVAAGACAVMTKGASRSLPTTADVRRLRAGT
jgi:ribokinase